MTHAWHAGRAIIAMNPTEEPMNPHSSARCASALLLAALVAAPQLVNAAEFDPLGRLTLDPAALTFGFEEPPAPGLMEPVLLDAGFNRLALDPAAFEANADGLEGAGALAFGGDRGISYWFLGEQWERFEGRRVQARLWVKAIHTDVVARFDWLSGDARAYLDGEDVPLMVLGAVTFHPTGRATTDGWVELETPPFDYMMASQAPVWLRINDSQHTRQSGWQGYPYDPAARALLDALEVVDLGLARTPSAGCDGASQEQVCGAGGICLMGRCVDAAPVWGSAPRGLVGEEYIARRLFELTAFAGPRYGRSQLPEVTARLTALDPDQVRDYWRGFISAFELLIDGHGAPPSNSELVFYHNSGICLGPGLADLLPDRDPEQLMPIVFTADPAFAQGARLQPGDALTAIDGIDTWEWVALHPELFSYNGDPRNRSAIATLSIVQAAKRLGATLSFERCRPFHPGSVCEGIELEVIEIDFAAELGDALWAGAPPDDLYAQSSPCDMRFEQSVPIDVGPFGFYAFAGWNDDEGIRSLLINGVPGQQSRSEERWHARVGEALSGQPARVLLDQRTGYGGTFEGVARIIGNLLDPQNLAHTMLIPWIGEEIEGPLLDVFIDCFSSPANQAHGCGSFIAISPTDLVNRGGASTSKLAVLNGHDVSGNDYLSRFLAYRQAPTRIFGYGPIIGAYGAACSFSSLLWETHSMSYQCHDSMFAPGPQGPFEGFESGIGVVPDEVVYQRQSDAVQGRDTMLEAARTWLLEADDQQGETP